MNYIKISMVTFISAFTFLHTSAQEACGTYEIYKEMMKNDPVFKQKQELFDACQSHTPQVQGVVTIPVVVHVVYNNEAENVSDEQIYSQLQVLNEDFSRTNADADNVWPQAANPEMEFCLASRDPYGNATCGITRTYTDSTEFRIQTSIKDESTGGISGWPATDYLNMFICDIAGGIRGYATFPDAVDSIDGIVIDYLFFGRGEEFTYSYPTRYHLGRTGTHEVGHWLRLRHVWGDGNCDIDDGLIDTPNAPGLNYGCNVNVPACTNQCPGYQGPLICMVQNYMDYSDDACMNLFTQQQVNLMRKAFDPKGSRVSILSSKGCEPPAQNLVTFTLNFDQFPEDNSWEIIDDMGNIIASDGNFPPGDALTPKVYSLDVPDGDYTLKLYDSFGDGFCCGLGSYEINLIYDEIIIDKPDFIGDIDNNPIYELSVPFSVNSSKFRFIGGADSDWYNPANWNRFSYPGECYNDDIIIEADCEVDQLSLSQQRNLTIKNNAQLLIKG